MKKVLAIVAILLITSVVSINVFAVTVQDPNYDPDLVPDNIKNTTKDVWATVVVLVQIASVACVVFAGLRYMFASADQRADIKQGLIYLAIGAVLVFGAVTIVQFVAEAASEILTDGSTDNTVDETINDGNVVNPPTRPNHIVEIN